MSVGAHSLYEKSDPYTLFGPGGQVDLSGVRFEQESERSVKVSGSRFVPAEAYRIKLEGAKRVGYRCVAVCPTGHVQSADDGPLRRMSTWKTDLDLATCTGCGQPFAAVRQLDHIRPLLPEHVPLESLCSACRRTQAATRVSQTAGMAEALITGTKRSDTSAKP